MRTMLSNKMPLRLKMNISILHQDRRNNTQVDIYEK